MSYFYMLQHDETHKNKIQKKKPHTKEEILYATRTNKYQSIMRLAKVSMIIKVRIVVALTGK